MESMDLCSDWRTLDSSEQLFHSIVSNVVNVKRKQLSAEILAFEDGNLFNGKHRQTS